MGRIIFNEDPNHFIYSRASAGIQKLTDDMVRDFILQYKDTNVTDFMICVNASNVWFHSDRRKDMISQYKEWIAKGKHRQYGSGDPVFECIHLLVDYYERTGKVMQDVWIETLREIGIRPWISLRMNDIHDCKQEDSILFSDFYRANRDKIRASHRAADDYYDYALDYTYPEVREYYLSVMEETLDRFDTDGIELDWMREIYSIGIGKEYEGITVMNEFMENAVTLVRKAEEKRGHPIQIAIRMPDTPEKALRLGFDVFEWVDRGWIDLITVTPRWASTDNDLPIDLWKKTFRNKPVTIAAGMEILIDAYNRRGRKYTPNTFESAVATSCAQLFMGADATYLFNYMDNLNPSEEQALLHGKAYQRFLRTAGDYEACLKETRRHIVTYNDVSAIGANGKKQLPVTVSGENGKAFGYRALRLVTGEIPENAEIQLILGFGPDTAPDPAQLSVYLSTYPCRFIKEIAPQRLHYKDMRYFVFAPKTADKLPPVSIIEIGLTDGKETIHWAEIQIIPQ